MEEFFLGGRVVVKFGDLAQEETDAIVNAANSTLMGGGGVDGAIHEAAGESLLYECKKIRRTDYPNGLPTGEAVITRGGDLKAKFVIHTVGPIYGSNKGKDAQMLSDCYANCLRLAAENNIETVSFPSISTGAFGYPKEEAAQISSQVVEDFLNHNRTIKQVFLVFYSQNDARIFLENHKFSRR
ncbi:MAG: O-acetyl-ADP-ribose deacetylase [Acidobacteriota bacterium]|nr:O-acetyl-ADP-ribose deacetylase [Acidobacteriota bacterium]